MNAVQLIEAKKNGIEHSETEIQAIVDAAAGGSLMEDYQLSAWLMAVCWRGMSTAETNALALAMARSGERVDLTGLLKPWVDKHSTGGVGDKTTLILLPLLAACGLTVVKMSGRGLGITGGTIDKLEAIPGFQTALSLENLKTQAGEIGLALTGQTPRLAPADGRLYALRDVTATVDSIPLIAASVMSKKIAGGAEFLSLDLKCGSGAFMKNLVEAEALAAACISIGEHAGLCVGVEITDMDQPLGEAVGNLIEVQEAVLCLMGRGPERLREFIVELAASTLVLARQVTWQEAEQEARRALESGAALEKARQWWRAQGATLTPEESLNLPLAPVQFEMSLPEEGWITELNARVIGQVALDLGAGRRAKCDAIDPTVGIRLHASVSDYHAPNEVWATVYARTQTDAENAAKSLSQAIQLSENHLPRPRTVLKRLMPS